MEDIYLRNTKIMSALSTSCGFKHFFKKFSKWLPIPKVVPFIAFP